MEENTYCVYKHTNKINGKVYIGQTKYGDDPNKRWLDGRGYRDSSYFGNAVNKYGWENFNHEILHNGLTLEEANYYESLEITNYNSMDPQFGYNQTGGGGNNIFSEDLRQKMVQIKNTPEYRENQRNKKLGKKLFPNGRIISDITKQKQSSVNMGKRSMYKNGTYTFVMADKIDKYLEDGWVFKGTPKPPRSEESKKKESEKLKQHFHENPRSEETNIKISIILKEKYSQDNNKYIYINKDNKCIKIREEELQKYLNDGWVVGKLIRKPRKPSNPILGLI